MLKNYVHILTEVYEKGRRFGSTLMRTSILNQTSGFFLTKTTFFVLSFDIVQFVS